MFMFHYKFVVIAAFSVYFFVYINAKGVGTSCFYPSDCGLWHFICENDICRCDKEHIPDKENKWCAVDIQKPCGYHDTCFDSNAECVGVAIPKYGSCECKSGFALHRTKKICAAVIGNNCSTSDECIEGTCKTKTGNFNDKQCTCNGLLQANKNGSKCLPGLHADCSTFNECARENAICNDRKRCVCDLNFKEARKNNEIYCLTMLDNLCQNATDCADIGADCVEKNATKKVEICAESKIYHWQNWPTKDPPKKYCICGKGFVKNPTQSECLKVATALNDICVHDIQCSTYSGIGSECSKGICVCKKGFYFDEDFNRCVRSCLCNDDNEINKIKKVLKEIAPTLELAAKSNNLDISRAVKRIKSLTVV